MSGKKPSLGRGLAELSPRCSRERAGAPAAEKPPMLAGDRLATLPRRFAAAGQVSAARRHAARIPERTGRFDQVAGLGAAHPGAPAAAAFPVESQRYEIIAGERRWRAAQMAGLAEIPAVIRDVPDEAAVAMALIENIQREDLNPLEEARALLRLIEEFGLTHQAAAEAVGRSRAAVSNLLRLMELADEVKEMLEHRRIEMGHARALLGLTTRRQQIEVAALVAKKSLSVRDTEGFGAPHHESAAADSADPAGRRIPTFTAWNANSPTNWAPKSRFNTPPRARASWSSATTVWTSSKASWRTSSSATKSRLKRLDAPGPPLYNAPAIFGTSTSEVFVSFAPRDLT